MGVKGSDQVCTNCRFYGLVEEKDDWGGCQLFQNRLVAGLAGAQGGAQGLALACNHS